MTIAPESLEALRALCIGFAFSGLLGSGYQLLAGRPVSFRLLQGGGLLALASIPVIVFSAPFIIIRNTVRGHRVQRRPFPAVVLAGAIAATWSLLCGRVVLDAAWLFVGA